MQTLIVAPGKSVSPGPGPVSPLPGVGPGGTVVVSDTDATYLIENGFCLLPNANVARIDVTGGAVTSAGVVQCYGPA